jgi:hypothetical protein
MTKFFAIDVGRFGGEGQKQFQVFGDNIDRKAAPQVRSVNTLEKFEDFIPPIIRQHYEGIVAGGTGYQGYRRVVSNIASARWDWQVDVPCTTGGNDRGRLPIRCKGGFFKDEVVEMGEPWLWIVDCRWGANGDDDAPWTSVEYWKVFQQVRRWRQAFTAGPQYFCFQQACSLTRTCGKCL